MDEDITIINRIGEILDTAEKIENLDERNDFLQECLPEINEFKDDLNNILRVFQFRSKDSKIHNDIVDKVKDNIIRLLNVKDFFENENQYPYFKSDIIEALSNNENRHAFRLQYETNMNNVESSIEYLLDREDYIKALKANNLFENQALNESAAKSYISNGYEQNMLGHALIILKEHFLSIPKADIVRLLNHLDKSSIVKEILSKDSKNASFYDKNLIYQYCETILKMKSIFTPDKFAEDTVIKQFWDGKINDKKTIDNILANCSIGSWENISKYDEKDKTNGFIQVVSNHFSSTNISNENLARIMKSIFDIHELSYEHAKFLAKIDLLDDYNQFIEGEHSEEYKWLQDYNTFKSLKDNEIEILGACKPFLPAEYYVKRLDKIAETPEINEHFVDNLITVLSTDYYNDEEKASLVSALKRNTQYQEFSNEEQIVFDENEPIELMMNKAKQSYERRQTIPVEIALKLINDDLSKKNRLDKKALEACVQSIVANNLKENEVDTVNGVYFGNSNGSLHGAWNTGSKSLWIEDALLEKYINAEDMAGKATLFETMFHEMQHAIQFDRMDKGEINYLTYNFIKEEVIQSFDEEFYKENYESMYIETDARKEQILGAMKFLKNLNPEFFKFISDDMKTKYINESRSHTLYLDAYKTPSIEKNKRVDISKYLGRLIQDNPSILEDFPVLACEYNQDGTQKDIKTLLNEFETKKLDEDIDYKNLYSIYYGLIYKEKDTVQWDDFETNNKVRQFMSEEESWITMEDMQNMYHSVPRGKMEEVYAKLMGISKNKGNIIPKREVGNNERDCR